MDKTKNLIKRKDDHEDTAEVGEKVSQLKKIKNKKFNINQQDYQGHELFTLNLERKTLFADQPRGVLVMVLGELRITYGNESV